MQLVRCQPLSEIENLQREINRMFDSLPYLTLPKAEEEKNKVVKVNLN